MFFCCLPVEEEDTSGYNCTPDGDPSSVDLWNDIYSIPVELKVSFSVPRSI